jgi:hypothetical protein
MVPVSLAKNHNLLTHQWSRLPHDTHMWRKLYGISEASQQPPELHILLGFHVVFFLLKLKNFVADTCNFDDETIRTWSALQQTKRKRKFTCQFRTIFRSLLKRALESRPPLVTTLTCQDCHHYKIPHTLQRKLYGVNVMLLPLLTMNTFHTLSPFCVGRDGSVGIATRYGLGGMRMKSMCRRDFPHPSTPAQWSTQPPT